MAKGWSTCWFGASNTRRFWVGEESGWLVAAKFIRFEVEKLANCTFTGGVARASSG